MRNLGVAMTKDRSHGRPRRSSGRHKDVVAALAWCDNPWCGDVYDIRDGWGGRCPSCLALADEHLSGLHAVVIEACVECRREPREGRRSA
jgi:hypothetical protein